MSNLLDKASIVLTPTAYSEGVVHTVKPEIELGDELVVNGDFENGSTGWSSTDSTISIVNNSCQISVESIFGYLNSTQSIQTTIGSRYIYSFDCLSRVGSGDVFLQAGTTTGGSNVFIENIGTVVDNESYQFIFTATSTVTYIRIAFGGNGSSVIIDNMSIKQITNPDFEFDRGTEATRVNSKGEVVDVNIIGSELVQNGNFEELGSELVTNGTFDTTLGSELITNGGFDTDSDWNTEGASSFSISNGVLNCFSDGAYAGVSQNVVLDPSKTYKLEFDVIRVGENSGSLNFGDQAGYIILAIAQGSSELGKKTFYFTPTQTTSLIRIYRSTACDIDIDNVSVKEVQGAEMWNTSGTWTIKDDKATCVNTTNNTSVNQVNVFTVGKTYKVDFSLSDYTSGGVYVGDGASIGLNIANPENKDYSVTYEPQNTSLYFRNIGTNGSFSIDNVSVKEVDPNEYWGLNDGCSFTDDIGVRIQHTPVAGVLAYNGGVLTIGNKYRFTYDILESNSGALKLNSAENVDMVSTVGSHTKDFIADATQISIGRTNPTSNDVVIDNISVKEITDDTDIPRINYEDFSYEEVLGDELVTNGGFDTDSDWIKQSSWSIQDGKANSDGTGSYQSISQQTLVNPIGKTYEVSYEVSNYVSGEVRCILGGFALGQIISSNGIITETITVTNASSNTYAYFESRGSSFTGSIDNISVKEVTQQVVEGSGTAHWLLEPESTNLITYSEDFSNAYWGKLGVNLESGHPSPDGGNNAYKVTVTDSASADIYRSDGAFNTNNTRSIYIKGIQGETTHVLNRHTDAESLITLTGQWQRIEFPSAGTTFHVVDMRGGTATEVYVFGAQTENIPYATSYIPTNGAQATRAAETLTGGGDASLINSEEGVLFVEAALQSDEDNNKYITLSDGSFNNRVVIDLDYSSSRIQYGVTSNSVSQCNIKQPYSGTNMDKIAVKWKENDFALWINGIEIATDNSGISPVGLDRVNFDSGLSSSPFYGKVKQLIVYKEALTDAELECLTTKRVKEYGEELVVNGDFSDGSTGWNNLNSSLSIIDGVANFTDNNTNGLLFTDNITVTPNSSYLIKWESYLGTMTGLKYSVRDMTNNLDIIFPTDYLSGTDNLKEFSFNITIPNGCSEIRFYPIRDSGNLGTSFIDNVSVKEIKSYL